MRQTASPSSLSRPCTAGRMSRMEIKDRSITARSMLSGNISGVRLRAFVRSMTTTRPSCLSGQASWP